MLASGRLPASSWAPPGLRKRAFLVGEEIALSSQCFTSAHVGMPSKSQGVPCMGAAKGNLLWIPIFRSSWLQLWQKGPRLLSLRLKITLNARHAEDKSASEPESERHEARCNS